LAGRRGNDYADDATLSDDEDYSKILNDKKETVQKLMDDIDAE
jgi:hypothetical protein